MWLSIITFIVMLLILRLSLEGGVWIELTALGIALLAIPFSTRWKSISLLNPVYLSVFYLLMAYPVRAIVIRLNLDGVREDFPGFLWDDDLLSQAMFAFDLGVLFFLIGYYQVLKKLSLSFSRLGRHLSTGNDSGWMFKMILIFLIGWGSVVLQHNLGTWSNFAGMGSGWSGDTNQLFAYLFKYIWFSFIGVALFLWNIIIKKSFIEMSVGLTIISATFILSVLLLGSKTWLMYPAFWLLCAAYVNDRKISKLAVIGFLSVFIVMVFIYVNAYRDFYRSEFGFRSDIGTGSTELVEGLFESGFGEASFTSASPLFNRFGGVDSLAKTISVFPDRTEYLYFEQLIVMPFTIIPRAIFPYKPTSDTAKMFTESIYRMTGGGSAAPHIIAEGYLNFGFLGVSLVCWLWGAVQGLLYRGFYLPNRKSPLVALLYLFYMLEAVGFGGWYLGWIAGLPGQLIVLLPLIFIVRAKVTRKGRKSSLQYSKKANIGLNKNRFGEPLE